MAGVAIVVVAVAGVVVAKQLSRVPENAMKMSVGILLITYGTFWTGEGLRVRWPGGDTMLLGLIGIYAVVSWLGVTLLRRTRASVSDVVA